MVTVRVPVPTGAAATNLLGVLSLLAVVVAIGGLAGVWWALLAAGLAGLGLVVLAQYRDVAAPAVADAPTRELKRVS